MLATYASFLLVLGASALAGQAILAAGGTRGLSPLAPAVGLAALVAVAWGAVRLPDQGVAVLVVLAVALVGCGLFLRDRIAPPAGGLAAPLAVAGIATVAASLPFLLEGRFGILGTGLNPDMSQHLFAADRLAAGETERLISEGYPLGPHALAVGLSALGPSMVHAFGGLTVASSVAAALAPLALLGGARGPWRIAGALAVAFAYLVAAYLVQGMFKETMQALFLLAFAICLHELVRGWRAMAPRSRALGALPLAALAIGSAYTYSFPGLAWLAGAVGAWAALALALALRGEGTGGARRRAREVGPAAALGLAVLAAALAPELGRLVEFARFETFDPDGPGLGNLFGRLSPLLALGIWPSGDFRVEPGGGAAPALAFYAGGALAVAALALGLRRWMARRELAVPAALLAATALWLYALTAGTPYQEAKALAIAAPLVALIAVRGLVAGGPRALAAVYLGAALASSALVLANGPVGPATYSPELRKLQPRLGAGSTLVLAPQRMLSEEHGRDYLVWELRGGRVCVAAHADAAAADDPPAGIAAVLVVEPPSPRPPYGGLERAEAGEAYVLWERRDPAPLPGPCPFVSDGARADPAEAAEAPPTPE